MSNISNDSQNKKKGLGRGLGSLLGGSATTPEMSASPQNLPIQASQTSAKVATPVGAVAAGSPTIVTTAQAVPVDPESKIWKVAIEKLQPGQYQPRSVFEKQPLQELANSIKENGILQPIVARRTQAGKLEIIAGERRWRAAQLAGLNEVPVILKTFNDKEALELAIVENIQREDLNPIDEAEGYQRLISEFNLTQQQVADKVGKERATVANAVRLLALPESLKDFVAKKQLSVGHAKVLLGLSDLKKQMEFAKLAMEDKLPVRKLEKLVQQYNSQDNSLEAKDATFESNVTSRLIAGLSEELQKMLGTKVSIDYTQGKGKISIQFYSDDELTQIVEKLREGCQK
ncbi:MAG: ParB/RepB/Spo0J family partition protein [Bdellovibrionia bacterium]